MVGLNAGKDLILNPTTLNSELDNRNPIIIAKCSQSHRAELTGRLDLSALPNIIANYHKI